jgi:hypothetical protein
MDKPACLEWLASHPVELLITAGAGDIDGIVQPVKEQLENK